MAAASALTTGVNGRRGVGGGGGWGLNARGTDGIASLTLLSDQQTVT